MFFSGLTNCQVKRGDLLSMPIGLERFSVRRFIILSCADIFDEENKSTRRKRVFLNIVDGLYILIMFLAVGAIISF